MATKFNGHDLFSNKKGEPGNGNNDTDAAITPQFLVVCEDLFDSELDGFDNATPCEWFDVGSSRFITTNDAGGVSRDSKIVGSDPVIQMKYGSWGPLIQEYLYSGKNIPTIGIRRLSCINGTKVIIQAIDYETCLVKTYRQQEDLIEFTFSAITAQDVVTVYDEKGTKQGNLGTKFDYSTMLINAIS
ncbi:hypothetical protein FACS189449_02090 [Alphaproteobacteria bacterium]|nr:hypothetical protein FACS189449_02090 [Alphaproteobacteria bacterium]